MLVKPGQLLRALQNHVSASLKSGKEENRPRFWQQKSATPPPQWYCSRGDYSGDPRFASEAIGNAPRFLRPTYCPVCSDVESV